MKKSLILVAAFFAAYLLTGCVAMTPAPVSGSLFTDVRAPIAVTSNSGTATKVGSATSTSVLGLVATGDASIHAAARNGGITRIHYVDQRTNSVMWFFVSYTVFVYGE